MKYCEMVFTPSSKEAIVKYILIGKQKVLVSPKFRKNQRGAAASTLIMK